LAQWEKDTTRRTGYLKYMKKHGENENEVLKRKINGEREKTNEL
jgi:hypothetical protein